MDYLMVAATAALAGIMGTRLYSHWRGGCVIRVAWRKKNWRVRFPYEGRTGVVCEIKALNGDLRLNENAASYIQVKIRCDDLLTKDRARPAPTEVPRDTTEDGEKLPEGIYRMEYADSVGAVSSLR